uniref:Coiled-coil domain-containing protein 93 n=1 Tax=Haemonchus placei TaxID=6290 RepID=A0A0N4WPC4_HAEPC
LLFQPDTKDDDEDSKYLMDCLDLLVAAGYFRARIKGLTTFDKIVGGMVWCLSHCNRRIDSSLVFEEDLDIGHKIILTEKVVRVLTDLQCPHRIEPHQIQGLDLQNIYPVIQVSTIQFSLGKYYGNIWPVFSISSHTSDLKITSLLEDAYCTLAEFTGR